MHPQLSKLKKVKRLSNLQQRKLNLLLSYIMSQTLCIRTPPKFTILPWREEQLRNLHLLSQERSKRSLKPSHKLLQPKSRLSQLLSSRHLLLLLYAVTTLLLFTIKTTTVFLVLLTVRPGPAEMLSSTARNNHSMILGTLRCQTER